MAPKAMNPNVAKKSERERQEIEQLESRVQSEAPAQGSLLPPTGIAQAKRFADLPISQYTLQGLERGGFKKLTLIQRFAVMHGLAGRDILGAAKTGSGKTLAFLVPAVERLYCQRWGPEDGLGAVVISPTRELALQIFEVLRVVSHKHTLTMGVVIGGKSYRDEAARISRANMLVCTPGRLLQHFEQTPMFDSSNLQVLILDEADRILDMGFKDQLTSLLSYMPPGQGEGGPRQTLLFSATQTKSVKELARLSLSNPEYVSVAEKAATPTPSSLAQSYAPCELDQKINSLYSFIRSHLKSKVVVFFSTCKQVRFIDAAFRRLRPGIPLMCLHGQVKQRRRMHIYSDFVNKPAAVLFATDIAARGLDFPSVDWVVQVDCPENADAYIHRVGRTARYRKGGKALLLLSEHEATGMLPLLNDARIPVGKVDMNPARLQDITPKLRAELAQNPELKMNATKAFKSYVRSVHLQTNKTVFNSKALPMAAFALSLGLMATPRVKIAGAGGENSRAELRQEKNKPKKLAKLKEMIQLERQAKRDAAAAAAAGDIEMGSGSEEEGGDDDDDGNDSDTMRMVVDLETSKGRANKAQLSKYERLMSRKASNAVAQSALHRSQKENDDQEDEEELLSVKRRIVPSDDEDDERNDADLRMPTSKKAIKRARFVGIRKVFDDEGEASTPFARLVKETESLPESVSGVGGKPASRSEYLASISARLQEEDKLDRLRDRERVKEAHRAKRLKMRGKKTDEDEEQSNQPVVVTLGTPGGESSEEESESGSGSESSSDDEEVEEDAEAVAMRMIQGM